MSYRLPLSLCLAAAFAASAWIAPTPVSAAPVVSNLSAAQQTGTQLVDIAYDVASPFGSLAVSLEISSDAGATWTVPATSATGHVGAGVAPGTGKAIVWDAGADWAGNYSEQMRFRVVADDLADVQVELFRVNEDPDDPELFTVETADEMISLYGEKANGAELVDLKRAVYAATDGEVIEMEFDEWFPSVIMMEGWAFVLSNWGNDTVDMTIFPPEGEGEEIFVADVPVDPNAIAEFRAAAEDESASGAMPDADEIAEGEPEVSEDIVASGMRLAGNAFKVVSWGISIAKCGGGIAAAVVSKGIFIPLAAPSCAPLAVKFIVALELEGASSLETASTAVDGILCRAGDLPACSSFITGLAGTELTKAANEREAFLNTRTGTLNGTVTDHNGQAAAGSYVTATRQSEGGEVVVGSARVGSDGSYRMRIGADQGVTLYYSSSAGSSTSVEGVSTTGGGAATLPLVSLPSDDGEMVRIPAGPFTMGRTSGDTDSNAPPVTVTVSEFYISKYQTTKALWDEVRAWGLDNGYSDLAAGAGKGANHPVHSVSWWDVVKWCNARSEKEGLTPVYTVGGEVMKTGTTVPAVNWGANGYRLPTEAEWEKAARGGVEGSRFPWGTDTISHDQANFRNAGSESYQSGTTDFHPHYASGTIPYTSPVGSFSANGYGIYDMAGNIFDWCWDWYGAGYYSDGANDPKGPASGSWRVARGSSWANYAFYARCSGRGNGSPLHAINDIGFRIARSLAP